MWVSYNLKLSRPVILCMNNPEIFTPEDEERKRELIELVASGENEERKRELIELVASGEAVLMVGAGSSARVGYVTWDGLLEKLEDLADQCDSSFEKDEEKRVSFEKDEEKRVRKPLEYAEDIKSYIREKAGDLGRYYNLLDDLFKPESPAYDEFHRLLVDLPFRGILTTNYDTVLEEALLGRKIEAEREGRQIRPIDVMPLVIGPDTPRFIHEFLLARNNDPHIPQRIAHLHGLYRYRESIILSTNDYIKAYGQYVAEDNETESNDEVNTRDVWTLHRKLLWAVLATRRVVFVGFSMEDPYFNKMLEIVSADLWGWNKSIHFAIMGISAKDKENIQNSKDKAERLKSKYGIDTVFYEILENEVPEKKHKLLESLFADIVEQCESRKQPVEEIQDLPSDRDRSEGEESETVSNGSRGILDWLKREGQRMIRRIGDED